MAVERGTYAQKAYVEIRRLVVEGEIAAGQKVVVRPLADRLGLSATPIKSALAALERDGFLTSVAHRGYFVPTVDADDMREIFELREVLDGIAARKVAADPGREHVVERLWHCFEQQVQAVSAGDAAAYGEVNIVFHQELWQASGNVRLRAMADNLIGQLRLATSASARAPGRMECAIAEHRTIVEAVASGDVVTAESASRAHVRRSAEAFVEGIGMDRSGGGAATGRPRSERTP